MRIESGTVVKPPEDPYAEAAQSPLRERRPDHEVKGALEAAKHAPQVLVEPVVHAHQVRAEHVDDLVGLSGRLLVPGHLCHVGVAPLRPLDFAALTEGIEAIALVLELIVVPAPVGYHDTDDGIASFW
ncbi:hypothetical protein QQS21_010100 [Conoideocrella luteorostrata]|uniref:Uncharacterized protein n=1 Tax=Conoideocrella luteorostrata TaxID=1105319 RepID=A0AAJ0FPR7_9HYPO|nr:hypothetical protein QQS21_010100 [Conoideocrella luteorostrata]